MRILVVNGADEGGGAERIASQLVAGAQAAGHDVVFAVGEQRTNLAGVQRIPNDELRGRFAWSLRRACDELAPTVAEPARSFIRLVGRGGEPVRHVLKQFGVEDTDFPGTRVIAQLAATCDVVHFHNLHGDYFDLRQLARISEKTPSVITLHDHWLMTGHCASPLECVRWETGCGHCPDLRTYPSIHRDATAFNWQRKTYMHSRSRFHVAAPSHWMLERAQRGSLSEGAQSWKRIPHGVDLNVFHDDRPKRDGPIRILLDVWPGRPTRDVQLALAALRMIAKQKGRAIELILIGDGEPVQIDEIVVENRGRVGTQSEMASLLRETDVYLHPSKQDVFPTAVMEAMACGVLVIASNVGGIPEQVTNDLDGMLVPLGDERALVDALKRARENRDDVVRMGNAAAKRAKKEFDIARTVAEYLDWYGALATRPMAGARSGQ